MTSRPHHCFRALAALLLWVSTSDLLAAGEMRMWTGASGKQVEAEFLGVSRGQIVLRTPAGKRLQTQLSSLSEADQQYITDLLKEQRAAEAARNPKPDAKLLEKYKLAHIVLSYEENRIDPNTLVVSGTVALTDNEHNTNTGALECWMLVERSDGGDNWTFVERAALPTSRGLLYGGGVSKRPSPFKVVMQTRRAMTDKTKFRVRLRNGEFDGKVFLYVTDEEYKLIKANE